MSRVSQTKHPQVRRPGKEALVNFKMTQEEKEFIRVRAEAEARGNLSQFIRQSILKGFTPKK